MKAVWFKGHKDKDERRKEILSYTTAFEDLKEILEKEETKPPVRDYGSGWAERQIAVNEWNAAIRHVINLIEVNKE